MSPISSHHSNDDFRQFFFVRDAKTPLEHRLTFERHRSPDWWVVVACMAGLAIVLLATGSV